MKAAAAVLGASLLFFLGVLTGAGRREAVPPPTAIPLGATNQPAGSGASRPSSGGAPEGGTKRTTTTTARPTSTTGATPIPTTATTTAATASTATTAASSTTTTTASGQVQQVDNQVDCTSARKQGKGKREPCPSSTTSSTGEAPGGGGNG